MTSGTEYKHDIGFCTELYKLEWLFPSKPTNAYAFWGVLVACSLIIILYILLKFRRQRQLLSNGQIKAMKEWLLPVYFRFLFFFIAIYGVKAIDIIVIYFAFARKYECHMQPLMAFIHGISFWTSDFWLLDLLFLFLASNSHGIATIRRSFWIATLLWLINGITVTLGIIDCHGSGFLYFIGVFGSQIILILLLMMYMIVKSFPHHKNIWLCLSIFFLILLFRLISDLLRYYDYDGFCFMDIADYISSIIMPGLIIYTLRKDSKHWRFATTTKKCAISQKRVFVFFLLAFSLFFFLVLCLCFFLCIHCTLRVCLFILF